MRTLAAALAALLIASPAAAANRNVGAGQTYATVRAAVSAASNFDSINVFGGTYALDHFTTSKVLYFRGYSATGTNSPKPIIDGQNDKDNGVDNQKGIWTFTTGAGGTTVDNFEFMNAANHNANGSGVRCDPFSGTFTMQNCYLHDCQMEFLGQPQTLLIQFSELYHSTHTEVECAAAPTCYEHCIYVNGANCSSATVQFSYVHQADTGNEIKSRATNTYILYDRIGDETSNAGYCIDIPDGGRAVILGNVIAQGVNSPNTAVVSYAAESAGNVILDLYVINNTLMNEQASGGRYIDMRGGTTAQVQNNIFYGPGAVPANGGAFVVDHNAILNPGVPSYFQNVPGYDFHLTSTTPGTIVNAGTVPGTSAGGFNLTPLYQYVYDSSSIARTLVGQIDIGAFEWNAQGTPPLSGGSCPNPF